MSLPTFPTINPPLTRDEVINQVLSSIAMEELGLSHIINAEGEKLQYALGTITGTSGPEQPASIEDLLLLNKSIRDTLESTMQNQVFLKSKLQTALAAGVMTGPTGATGPEGPVLSGYLEASANKGAFDSNNDIVFVEVGNVGQCVTMNTAGTEFSITRPGLYNVEWSVNLKGDDTDLNPVLLGLYGNGAPLSALANSFGSGNLSSGALIRVGTEPYILSLRNRGFKIEIEDATGIEHTAGSIRIMRFASGPTV